MIENKIKTEHAFYGWVELSVVPLINIITCRYPDPMLPK
jgi:hypothetical protein